MDLFGTALLDYQNGLKDRPFVMRRDDGFVHEHSVGVWFSEDLPPHEIELVRHIDGRVLDVGCGVGRHLLRLQQQDVEATGIDFSPGAISVCKLRGCENAHLADVMALDDKFATRRFDTILLFGHNIGIGGTLEGACALLTTLRSLVSDNGRLLITSMDVATTSNPVHLKYHEQNIAGGRPRGDNKWCMEYGGKTGDWFRWLHPQPTELEELARDSNWSVETISVLPSGLYGAVLVPA